MNPLLKVNLKFRDEGNKQVVVHDNLRAKNETTIEKVDEIVRDLRAVVSFYDSTEKLLDGILIDIHYNDIIAKSNRIKELLKPNRKDINDVVVGARFSDDVEGEEKHIITYYVDRNTIDKAIRELGIVRSFLVDKLNGKAKPENFNEPACKLTYDGYELSKSLIRKLITDCSVIESLSVPSINTEVDNESFLVTFYKTEKSVSELLERIELDYMQYRYSFYGADTILVNRDIFKFLIDKIPYMISMVSSDFSKVVLSDYEPEENMDNISIPNPTVEPTIGVIDTIFDENVYFRKWVDYREEIEIYEKNRVDDDYKVHGTQISSIIVDGPRLNPWLDDGCGRFRVRHFGVCLDRISTARLVNKIKNIIMNNPDIHVWNLSLGTEDEVSKNFISFDASVLDELQAQKNIIFVVAGTNDTRDEKMGKIRIGSPADSLNAVVVNSVRRDGRETSYSRKGDVLSFFKKPDVSYYGGDINESINTYTPYGEREDYGTSLAAPWISRKLAFLIDVMGMPIEVAKALIIDAAAGWEYKKSTYKKHSLLGYGVVPIDIQQVLASDKSEIKFYLYGTSRSYKTVNYAIPIPRDSDGKYPFIARATLCYAPECTRSQGVDYTNRELSLQFGRVTPKGTIDDINENVQDDDVTYIDERQSRKEHRKWENTKFISKVLKKNRALISYDDRQWGFAITSKERNSSKERKDMNFGVVITLKEINDINRINDFITLCEMRGWIVNEINIQNKMDIYINNQEEIHFT